MVKKDTDLLTVKEVADYLRMGLLTVYKLIQTGKIPAFKIGKQWRIKKEDLEKYIEVQKLEPKIKKPKQQQLEISGVIQSAKQQKQEIQEKRIGGDE